MQGCGAISHPQITAQLLSLLNDIQYTCLNKDEDDVAGDSAEDCDGDEFKQMGPNESEFSITLHLSFYLYWLILMQ